MIVSGLKNLRDNHLENSRSITLTVLVPKDSITIQTLPKSLEKMMVKAFCTVVHISRKYQSYSLSKLGIQSANFELKPFLSEGKHDKTVLSAGSLSRSGL